MYKKALFLSFSFIIFTGNALTVLAGHLKTSDFNTAAFNRVPITFIYAYKNNLLIAQVNNAQQSEVAYTSFESAEKGYWNYGGATIGDNVNPGRTGTRYYDLATGAIDRNVLPAGKYVVSYWSKGGAATISGSNYSQVSATSDAPINGWFYNECVFQLSAAGNIQLSGNIQLDELRLHPVTAQMVTYTYNNFSGKTSETDINNITTYYEYDEFFRLKCVKDQFGQIKQNLIYHLKNQL
jgi:hypothetical protein